MIRLLFVSQILFNVLTLALPAPPPAPPTFRVGEVAKAKPKHFVDGLPGNSRTGAHPLIIMTEPDKDGFVRVASITHTHPTSGTPTRQPEDFGVNVPQEDPTKPSGTVSVAAPHRIHISNIKSGGDTAMHMEPHQFEALKAEMRKNCGNDVLRRRADPDPCDHVALEEAAAKAWRWSPKRAAALGFKPKDKKNWWKKKTPADKAASSSSAGAGGSQAHGGNPRPSKEQSKGKAKAHSQKKTGRKSRSPSPNHKAKTGGGSSGSVHHASTHK